MDVNCVCNPNPQCTLCTGDKKNNLWFTNKTCWLDQITYDQFIRVLEHVHKAKPDLLRITTDTTLISLANDIPIIRPEQEENDIVRRRLTANSLQFYTVFKGNTSGNIPG